MLSVESVCFKIGFYVQVLVFKELAFLWYRSPKSRASVDIVVIVMSGNSNFSLNLFAFEVKSKSVPSFLKRHVTSDPKVALVAVCYVEIIGFGPQGIYFPARPVAAYLRFELNLELSPNLSG